MDDGNANCSFRNSPSEVVEHSERSRDESAIYLMHDFRSLSSMRRLYSKAARRAAHVATVEVADAGLEPSLATIVQVDVPQ